MAGALVPLGLWHQYCTGTSTRESPLVLVLPGSTSTGSHTSLLKGMPAAVGWNRSSDAEIAELQPVQPVQLSLHCYNNVTVEFG